MASEAAKTWLNEAQCELKLERYHEAIAVLSGKVMEFPNSRAAASLIAYCYYYVADYASAIAAYERLVKLCPDVEQYKLYLAQALFKGGHYDAATKACQAVGDSEGQPSKEVVVEDCGVL